MEDLQRAWTALQFVGIMAYPLLFLGVLVVVILLDKAFVYWRYARPSGALFTLAATDGFDWSELEQQLARLGSRNYFGRFSRILIDNRDKPVWWLESRAGDEARAIEKALSRGLWILETIVTGAPLLGLLGTIAGMMNAFRIISGSGLVEPSGITAGVAQALIATALGIFIAVVALFEFNFFSRLQSKTLDEMEHLGTRMVEHIRLDQQAKEVCGEIA